MMGRNQSTKVDVSVESHNENGENTKEQQGVYDHSFPICTKSSEIDMTSIAGKEENEARREQNEQQQTHQNRRPIHHLFDLAEEKAKL